MKKLLLPLLAALPLAAAPTVVSGKVYDVGKLIYSQDAAEQTGLKRNDRSMCWAAAGANLLQHWQDTYYDLHDADKTVPNGLAAPLDLAPRGTAYLQIYRDFLEQWTDGSGLNLDAFVWYLQGGQAMLPAPSVALLNHVSLLRDRESGAYYSRTFTEPTKWHPGLNGPCGCFVDYGTTPGADMEYAPKTAAELQRILDAMLQTQGQAGLLAFMVYERMSNGEMGLKGGHAVSCWGYETDPAGKLCALYLTDSDDSRLSAFRVDVQEVDGVLELSSADPASNYAVSPDRRLVLCALSHINTPAAVAKQSAPAAELPPRAEVACNTQLTAPAEVEMLDVKAGMVVGQTILTSAAPLQVQQLFSIRHGALVSLRSDGKGRFHFGCWENEGQCRVAHAELLEAGFTENFGYCELDDVAAVRLVDLENRGCLVLNGSTVMHAGNLWLQPAAGQVAAMAHGALRGHEIGGVNGACLLRNMEITAEGSLQLQQVSLSGACRIQAEQGVRLNSVVWAVALPQELSVDAEGVAEVDMSDLIKGAATGDVKLRLTPADRERLKAAGARAVRVRLPVGASLLLTVEGLRVTAPCTFAL